MTTTERLLDLTAGDVMTRDVATIPHRATMAEAARLLRDACVTGAPVIDERGRCVGVLSATDFLRWAEDAFTQTAARPPRTCPYQTVGRLLTGEQAVICELAPGSCPLQSVRPTIGGGHTAVCLQPTSILCDWQQVHDGPTEAGVRHYLTTDVVSAGTWVPLAELARMMVDAHVHRVVVLDVSNRPVGVVSATDVLAALARSGQADGPDYAMLLATHTPEKG